MPEPLGGSSAVSLSISLACLQRTSSATAPQNWAHKARKRLHPRRKVCLQVSSSTSVRNFSSYLNSNTIAVTMFQVGVAASSIAAACHRARACALDSHLGSVAPAPQSPVLPPHAGTASDAPRWQARSAWPTGTLVVPALAARPLVPSGAAAPGRARLRPATSTAPAASASAPLARPPASVGLVPWILDFARERNEAKRAEGTKLAPRYLRAGGALLSTFDLRGNR